MGPNFLPDGFQPTLVDVDSLNKPGDACDPGVSFLVADKDRNPRKCPGKLTKVDVKMVHWAFSICQDGKLEYDWQAPGNSVSSTPNFLSSWTRFSSCIDHKIYLSIHFVFAAILIPISDNGCKYSSSAVLLSKKA